MTRIRAAVSVHLPPRMFWGGKNRWTRRDLLITEAYQMYADSLCGACGQTAFHALDVANTRQFSVDTVTCLGCNVREIWAETHGDQRTKGEKVYVVNTMGEGDADDGEYD